METLRIGYADFWPEWSQENFIEPILKKHYKVVIDQNNPDVLIHSIFNARRDTPKYKCKKILVLAENWRPARLGSDYSISFDPHSETNYRLPLWQIYLLLWPGLKARLFNRVHHDDFVRFCSFTVSNPGNFLRNAAFEQLSKYKKVHSYGKHMNNDPLLVNYTHGKYWRDAKDAFFTTNPHKFMLAYENNAYPGYCTEKLMDSFLAGSIPIYWGDPGVKKEFNPKAFINVMDYPNSWWSVIKGLDNNQEAFEAMYNEPVFTDEQKKGLLENLGNFENWMIDKVKE
ncbi:MAG: hypothetical protein HC831_20870 [Chloroflexia bacterium]|nr:hypothetical protein [Chloroflexia bacterium]